MSDEFEEALHRALRRRDPGHDLETGIVSRLDSSAAASSQVARLQPRRWRPARSRWLPVALAACVIAGIGLLQIRQHSLQAGRALEARAQLLQALSIASQNVNIVRDAVAREENPDS